jgi:hypothetical protein
MGSLQILPVQPEGWTHAFRTKARRFLDADYRDRNDSMVSWIGLDNGLARRADNLLAALSRPLGGVFRPRLGTRT